MNIEHITFIGTLKCIEGLKKVMAALPDDCIILKDREQGLDVELNGDARIYPSWTNTIQSVNPPEGAKNIRRTPDSVSFQYGEYWYIVGLNTRIDTYTRIQVEKELKEKYKITG